MKKIFYNVFFLTLIFLVSQNMNLFGQTSMPSCGYEPDSITKEMTRQVIEKIKNKKKSARIESLTGVVTIPVVVHVIEPSTSSSIITDAQIQTMITNLSSAYRATGSYIGGLDIQVEFALAKKDPSCNATTGITRYDASTNATYVSKGVFGNGVSWATVQGWRTWDKNLYMNVWLVHKLDNGAGGVGGPGNGFIALASSAAASGSGDAIVPHEVGHYLGLAHPFPSDMSSPGTTTGCNCGDGDGLADTPNLMAYGILSDATMSNCSHLWGCTTADMNSINPCTGTAFGAIQQNFMNYLYNGCGVKFTNDQKTLMRNFIESYHSQLLTSPVLQTTPITPAAILSTPASFCTTSSWPSIGASCLCSTVQSTTINGTNSASLSGKPVLGIGQTTTWTYVLTCANGTISTKNVLFYNPGVSGIQSTCGTGGKYSVTFSNPNSYVISASVGTLSGNTVTNIPQGTNLVLTVSDANGCGNQQTINSPCCSTSPVAHCNVTATNGLSMYFGISNFSLGTINYTGSSSSILGTNYQDNTCTKTDMQAGNPYPFTLTGMYGNYMLGNIYIDYNNDGDFDDTNETAFEGSWQITQTGNITPPSTAVTNTYLRMRVMLDAGLITSCLLDGLSSSGSGLALDFSVKILPANCTTSTAPTTTSVGRCGSGSVTLSASDCAGTYNWYSASTGGTSLATTANYTTPSISTSTTYYVDCTVGACTSTRSSATATINTSTIPVPTVSSTTINSGQTATLTATSCTGTVNWFDMAIGGTSLGVGTSFTTPTLTATTTYYAECTSNTCTSTTRGSGTITVNQSTITLGTLASTNYCMGNYISVPFTTTLPAGTVCTATLKKGASIINTSTVTVGNISGFPYTTSLYIPWNQDVVYGTDYTIQITSGANSSVVSPSLTIGNIMSAYISDVNNNSIYTNPDYLCTGKTKVYYATVKDNWGNVITNGVSYQWQKDGVAIVGATTNSLNVTQSGVYSFVAIQGACSRTANSITLQVGTINNQSTIVYGDAVACAGTSKRVESSYYSNTATYQWQRDGVTISGAVNRTYDATQSGLYKVIATDGTCTNTSYEQRLTFGTGLLATITASSNDTTLCGGNSKYLSASIYTINPTQYTYQWQKDGVNISGAVSNGYSPTQAGVYSVTYTQGACSSTSRGITIVSSTLAQKPVITAGSITNICNGSIIINQNINGNYSYLYGTWYKDGVIITPNSTTYQYIATTSGSYKMVYGSGACANESNTVTVNIGSTFTPKIYIPTFYGKTNLCGTGDYLYIYFDNQNLSGGTYTYQWQKDGVNIAGATNQYLYVTTVGNYTLSVSNGSCSGISNGIAITNNTSVVSITASENNIFCTNKTIRLDLKGANSYFTTPVVWKKDGATISGETSSFLYTNQAGAYTATYNQNGCNGTSSTFNLNIGYPSFITQSPASINNGQTANLIVLGCVGTVNWYDVATGGTPIGTNALFTTPPLNTSTSYYSNCSVNGCMNPNRAVIPIIVNCTNLYSLKTGNWNDISVWSCGRLPNSSDTVTISSGNSVTIPSGQTGFLYNLIQKGILVNNGLLKFGN